MRSFEVAAAVAALSSSADAMGLNSLARDLTLASTLGIKAEDFLGQRKTLDEIAMERADHRLDPQYVSVWYVFVLYKFVLTSADSD